MCAPLSWSTSRKIWTSQVFPAKKISPTSILKRTWPFWRCLRSDLFGVKMDQSVNLPTLSASILRLHQDVFLTPETGRIWGNFGLGFYIFPVAKTHFPQEMASWKKKKMVFNVLKPRKLDLAISKKQPWKLASLVGKSPFSIGNTSSFMVDFPASHSFFWWGITLWFLWRDKKHTTLSKRAVPESAIPRGHVPFQEVMVEWKITLNSRGNDHIGDFHHFSTKKPMILGGRVFKILLLEGGLKTSQSWNLPTIPSFQRPTKPQDSTRENPKNSKARKEQFWCVPECWKTGPGQGGHHFVPRSTMIAPGYGKESSWLMNPCN